MRNGVTVHVVLVTMFALVSSLADTKRLSGPVNRLEVFNNVPGAGFLALSFSLHSLACEERSALVRKAPRSYP